jgi:methylmalonyl-CoA/ethylmalonyl-CoA epimerase
LADPPLHHVGIVQPDEDSAQQMMQVLGLNEEYRGYVPAFQASCIFTRPVGRTPIEFVIPDGGPLTKFNKGAGGLHHLAFEVPDLEALMADFAREGTAMLEPAPVRGAGNFICNFLRPSATRGVIVEYIQIIEP